MAVVNCAGCGKPVNSEAVACPQCGADPLTGAIVSAPQRLSDLPYEYTMMSCVFCGADVERTASLCPQCGHDPRARWAPPDAGEEQKTADDRPPTSGLVAAWRLYTRPWRKFASFSGRADLAEYWLFCAVNFAIALLLLAVPHSIYIQAVFSLAVPVPTLAAGARRLHDRGSSGWCLLLPLVPFVGGFSLLILLVWPSQEGDNQWGPNPNGPPAQAPANPVPNYHVWTPDQQ